MSLTGLAGDWFDGLSPEETGDCDTFERAFLQRYSVNNNDNRAAKRLLHSRPQFRETPLEYVTAMRMAARCVDITERELVEIILGGICDNTRPFFTSANPLRLDDLESIAKSVGPSSLPTFAGTPTQPPACQPVSTAAAPSANQILQGQSILATVAEQLWPPVLQNKRVAMYHSTPANV